MWLRKLFVLVVVLLHRVHVCGAVEIGGEIWRVDELTANEIAKAYDQSPEVSLRVVVENEARKRFSGRNGLRHRVAFADVRVLSVSGGKVVAEGKSDREGAFSLSVSGDLSSMYRIIAESTERAEGKPIYYSGVTIKRPFDRNCYVELHQESLALQGRCLDGDGKPTGGKLIRIVQFPHSENENLKRLMAMFALTGPDGRWSCAGLRLPSLNDAAVFMANTNMLGRTCFEDSPLSVRIEIYKGDEQEMSVKEVESLTLTESLRAAVERIVSAYERKKGMPYPRKGPLINYPVSTANVIHVPDIVLP